MLRHARAVGATAVMVLILGTAPSTSAGAEAPPAPDSYPAVTFQQNARHDGHSQDPAFRGPLSQAWSVQLIGEVAYPLIADGLVFAMSDDKYERGRSVTALSASDGHVVWGPQLVGGVTGGESSFSYDAGRIFVTNDRGGMMALDARTGALQWNVELPFQHVFDTPPAARDGVVYVVGTGSGGIMYAVDQDTGRIIWMAAVDVGGSSAPALDDEGIYVSSACKVTYKLAFDGSVTWVHSGKCTGGGGTTPVLHDGRVYVRDLDVTAWPSILDAATGSELEIATYQAWTTPAFDQTHMVTVAGGLLTVRDARSGEPLWQAPGTDHVTPPLVVNGYVLEGRRDGKVDMRDVRTGALVWRGKAPSTMRFIAEWAAPPRLGMAQGDGILAVPAGSTLTVFRPVSDPAVTITGAASGAIVNRDALYRFTSSEPHPQFVCSVDGVEKSCTSPWSPRGLPDGPHSLEVRLAYATAGAARVRFTYDGTAPVPRASFPTSVIRGPETEARWAATDRGTGVKSFQVRVARSRVGQPLSAWKVLSPTSKKTRTFSVARSNRVCISVRAADRAGNWSAWTKTTCVRRA